MNEGLEFGAKNFIGLQLAKRWWKMREEIDVKRK